MASRLQGLRKQAGYRSARDFAEAAGIPFSTYARYEQQPEKIPLASAWELADRLGCSIDDVVGRAETPSAGEVQRRYDALSEGSRQLVSEFLDFAEERDKRELQRQEMEREQLYIGYAQTFERLFFAEASNMPDFAKYVYGDDKARKEIFGRFVQERAKESSESELAEFSADARRFIALERGAANKAEGLFITEADLSLDAEGEAELAVAIEARRTELEIRDKEVTEKIMAAYDQLHGEPSGKLERFDFSLLKSAN